MCVAIPALFLQHRHKLMFGFVCLHSKMINLSVPDTIDERTINKKKLSAFTVQVSKTWIHDGEVFFFTINLYANLPTAGALFLTGESEPGPELRFCHRLPRGEHRCFRPERGETSSGAGSAVADHQDWSVCRHRAQQEWRYGPLLRLFIT